MSSGDVAIELFGHVALVEIRRPPHNFFDVQMVRALASAFETLDDTDQCRAIVLAAQGKSFCAGAKLDSQHSFFDATAQANGAALYREAVRLFSNTKPVVGAIQGGAIGGGLGVALVPDFRVVSPQTQFSANFVKLGIHSGFGISATLPMLIGQQKAALMLYTGRRVTGQEALQWGLADVLTETDTIRKAAFELAQELADCAPLAVQSTRQTLRMQLAEIVKRQTEREFAEQLRLARTADHAEGVRAVGERRTGRFSGR